MNDCKKFKKYDSVEYNSVWNKVVRGIIINKKKSNDGFISFYMYKILSIDGTETWEKDDNVYVAFASSNDSSISIEKEENELEILKNNLKEEAEIEKLREQIDIIKRHFKKKRLQEELKMLNQEKNK